MRQGGTVNFLHGDHLGSTSLTTDQNGNVVARQLYDAWGNVRLRGDLKTDLGYTSQREDVSTNLMFYRARYYSPAVGRFLSADTIVPQLENPQAWNRYAYVVNSPLKYNDPTGHCFFICGLIGGAIGAIAGAVGYTAQVITTGSGWNSDAYWASVGAGAGTGALIGSTLGVVAPAALEATSVTLAGASAATGSGTLATAATTTYAAATTVATADVVAFKVVSDELSQLRQFSLAPSSPAPSVPNLGTPSTRTSTALTNYWPSNRGFYGETTRTHLMPGEVVDRYGYEGGTFVSPKGTPFEMRALPPESLAKPYHAYQVMKPIESVSGITAPAFGQIGFGRAYELPRPVSTLLRRGFLREIDP
jgi:RHS repeat-associated protein